MYQHSKEKGETKCGCFVSNKIDCPSRTTVWMVHNAVTLRAL